MDSLGKTQKYLGLLLISAGLLIIPLTLGALVLSQISKSGTSASAQVAGAVNKCDVNRDGTVDRNDIDAAAKFYGKVTTEEAKIADMDGNNMINSNDFLIIAKKEPSKCVVQQAIVTPGCKISPTTIVGGSQVTITSTGGLAGEVRVASALGSNASTLLGTLNANTTLTVTIPLTLESGLYTVRVGSLGVSCGDVTITNTSGSGSAPLNRCDFNSDGKVNELDIEIAAKYYGVNARERGASQYDIDGNNSINSNDFLIIAQNNPKYCTQVTTQ